MEVVDTYTGEIKEMIYMASNDYLNLTRHPRVLAAGQSALLKYGAGAGSVPLLGGTLDIHTQLEKDIAAFKGCEDAIIYTSDRLKLQHAVGITGKAGHSLIRCMPV